MDRQTNPRLHHRAFAHAYADDRLGPQGKDTGRATAALTRIHPQETWRRVAADVQRQTQMLRHGGRIPQEAKAQGQATGEADVGTVVGI